MSFLLYLGNLFGSFDNTLYQVDSAKGASANLYLGHLWSLCVDEQFYLLWPLVVWKIRDRINLIWIAAAFSLVALVFRASIVAMSSGDVFELVSKTLPGRMDALLIGAILALLLRGDASATVQRGCKWVFLIAGALVATVETLSPKHDSPWLLTIGYTLIAIASAGLIGTTLLRGSAPFRLFTLRPLRILGKYSYGFYIYHLVWAGAWWRFQTVMISRLHSHLIPGVLMDVLSFAVTFLVAKVSYDLFEVRFLGLKKNFEYDSELVTHKHAFTLQ
jgi:peptidoglycan/LPS O-acetylase OafA/YrhL